MKVRFEGVEVENTPESDALKDLSLAYAPTIHKSQGSEFPCAVVAVHKAHSFMHHRNLFYTGVTRHGRWRSSSATTGACATAPRRSRSSGERPSSPFSTCRELTGSERSRGERRSGFGNLVWLPWCRGVRADGVRDRVARRRRPAARGADTITPSVETKPERRPRTGDADQRHERSRLGGVASKGARRAAGRSGVRHVVDREARRTWLARVSGPISGHR
ncbi:ATP-binding domain-containing protein [Sorangium sp. So ce341]|uniref:ATP-binding domain-containing protein n=1 Tax=Sorangium sp. So ce341 TaxID=3133302 RepID=UPI003F61668A